MNPTSSEYHRDFALLLATCSDNTYRNGARSVELATKAIQLANARLNWQYHAALAAAYAENGDFETAVQEQNKAVADKLLTLDQRRQMGDRILLYKARKAFHQE